MTAWQTWPKIGTKARSDGSFLLSSNNLFGTERGGIYATHFSDCVSGLLVTGSDTRTALAKDPLGTAER